MLDLQEVAANPDHFCSVLASGAPFRPLYVKIKLTWRCNLHCVMCNVWRQRRRSRLSLAVMEKLADEFATLGTRKVHLTGGEVLLHPDIFAIIAAFATHNIQVNLTTNGTLLDEENAARLVESGVRNVSLSLDGASAAVHDGVRGRGSWKRSMRGLRNLRRAAKHARKKMHIRVNTVISRLNYLELGELPAVIREAGADRLTLIPVDDVGDRLHLNKSRILEYNRRIAPGLAAQALELGLINRAEQAYPFGQTSEALEWSKQGMYARGLYSQQPCYIPWLHAMIAPQGQVYPCCMLRSLPPIGNFIDAGSFTRVWNGSIYREFRQEMQAGNRPLLCQACDDFLEENRLLHRLTRSG